MHQVGCLLKKYARRAGLDPQKVTVHTLRHTAAMLRKQAGDDVEQIPPSWPTAACPSPRSIFTRSKAQQGRQLVQSRNPPRSVITGDKTMPLETALLLLPHSKVPPSPA